MEKGKVKRLLQLDASSARITVMNISPVSAKNTKAEILAAYQGVARMVREGKDGGKGERKLGFRERVLSQVERIEAEIAAKSAEAESLVKKIEELKKRLGLGERVKFTLEKVEELEEKIRRQEASWQRRREGLEKDFEEEGKWASKRLEQELAQRKWEFDHQLKQKERRLAEREEEFKSQVTGYEKLETEVAVFPEQLEEERARAVADSEKQLKSEFETEKKHLRQQFEAAKQLLEQKAKDLENRLSDQKAVIKSLQDQLSSANQQIKQIAVAALQAEPQKQEPSK